MSVKNLEVYPPVARSEVGGWDDSGVSSSVWFLGVLESGVWFECRRGVVELLVASSRDLLGCG